MGLWKNEVSRTWVENYVGSQAVKAMDYQGGYDASTNTPDLDTSPLGIKKGDFYTVTVAGTFFTTAIEAGDALIAEKDDPTLESNWTIVNKNIAQDDYQLILSEGAFEDGDKSKLDAINQELATTSTPEFSGLTLSDDLDGQGNYLTNIQNIPDMIAGRGPGYYFDGVDDKINLPSDSKSSFGVGDFSLIVFLDNYSLDRQICINITNVSGHQLYMETPDSFGKISCAFYAAPINKLAAKTVESMATGSKSVSWICDRDTGNYIYVNGKSMALSTDTKDNGVTTIGTPNGITGFGWSAASLNGKLFKALFFNLALSAEEVKAFSSGAPIPFHMIGASQTELTSGTLIIGKKYRIKTWITTDDFTNVGAASNANGIEFIATGATPTTWVNSSVLVQIGCVLDLSSDGIGHNTWVDTSGNNLMGVVSGALPINLPANHREKYIATITGDTSFILPTGYMIEAIVLTSDGAIGGGIDIGTSNGGGEIVSAQAIADTTPVICTLVAGANYNTTGADDTIYISDADGSGWDSATVEVVVNMKRVEV